MNPEKMELLANMLAQELKTDFFDRGLRDFKINRFVRIHWKRDESDQDRVEMVKLAIQKTEQLLNP